MRRFDPWRLLPHVCIILALMVVTFLIIDRFNTAMNFINNDMTKGILAALCVLSVACCICLIKDRRELARRRARKRERRALEERERRLTAKSSTEE